MLVSKPIFDFKKYNEHKYNLLGKVFKIDSSFYYYDTGTNKVLSCTAIEYSILSNLLENSLDKMPLTLEEKYSLENIQSAEKNIFEAVENEKILQANPNNDYHKLDIEELKSFIFGMQSLLTLEVTSRCNLRCIYCLFSEHVEETREFGDEDMSWETAKEAIDQFRINSVNSPDISITFYGGEPLLNFHLIKQVVTYSQQLFLDKKINYSLTTNLVLMDKEKAEYIASIDNFFIHCSLDGPAVYHDAWRVDRRGRGSHAKAIKGYQNLRAAIARKYHDDQIGNYITINCVFCPPYTVNKIAEIRRYFSESSLFKGISSIRTEYVNHAESIWTEDTEADSSDVINMWSEKKLATALRRYGEDDSLMKSHYRLIKRLLAIHSRVILKNPQTPYSLLGCCIPFNRKIFVDLHGNYSLCENAYNVGSFGSVKTGLDINKIMDVLIRDYEERISELCKNCWAKRLCSTCYIHQFKNGKMKHDLQSCKAKRNKILGDLIYYYKCISDYPELSSVLDEFN